MAALTAIDLVLRGAVISLLLLCSAAFWRAKPGSQLSVLGALLAAGLCAYTVHASQSFHPLLPYWLDCILLAVANGNAVVFWIFALLLFNDDFICKTQHIAIWLCVVALAASRFLWRDSLIFWSLTAPILDWLPIGFALLVIATVLRTWRIDLVEPRRRLRAFIIVAGTAYMLATAVARLSTSDGAFSPVASVVDIALLGTIAALIAWQLLSVKPNILVSSDGVTNSSVATIHAPKHLRPEALQKNPKSELANALQSLIDNEKIYREENLSVHSMATRLKVPEYKLRQLINQELGYRNFNDFLNSYRLEHVTSAMADGGQRHLPVLTLALDAGFQSIGPFNRGFKSKYGVTPTEYRKNIAPISE